ncbi:M96 mating-specific protein family [Phytophthora palmivora]|uniref:M96 mating-specific protein family n=1 Tax=Phytophthora palmivora TaxID=4796 RepID=A0A2P4Y6J5_9STRA|nr:M96 mating-specific protein family [Phytophthora palmivora]
MLSGPPSNSTPITLLNTSKKPRPAQRKRGATYNPNFARQQQRKELHALRVEVIDLESQLAAIQQVRQRTAGHKENSRGQSERTPFVDIARGVWMTTAQQQLVQRMKATKENRRLKSLAARNVDIISKLQELLQQCSLDKVCPKVASHVVCLRTYDSEDFTRTALDQLTASADKSFQQVDNVFSQCCFDVTEPSIQTEPEMMVDGAGRVFYRVFGTKIFPFPHQQTGRVVWDVTSKQMVFVLYLLFYFYFSHQILHSTVDTVVESCGTELYTDDSKAIVFHTRQIKRRYQEGTRDVIVWQSHVRPVLFEGRYLHGATFKENGVFLIHHHPLIPSGFTLLQTCYMITPGTPMSELPKDPLAREVANFVLKCMAASISESHKVFENALIGQTFP